MKVLIVASDVRTRAEAAALLRTCGHTVREAGDGPSAVATACAERPDVILVDLKTRSIDPDSIDPDSVVPDSVVPDSVVPGSVVPDSVVPGSVVPGSAGGIGTAQMLRDRLGEQTPPLISMSGDSADRERALAASFSAHIVKPVDLASLVAALAEVASGAHPL
jgi:CheY-like chemotaxis protein